MTVFHYGMEKSSGLRRHLRAILMLLLPCVGVSTLYYFRDDLERRTLRAYWGDRCMKHVTPPDTALMEYDRSPAQALLAANEDYVRAFTRYGGTVIAEYSPKAFRMLSRIEPV